MSVASDKKELLFHIGHNIEVRAYGKDEDPKRATVECIDCHVILYEEED